MQHHPAISVVMSVKNGESSLHKSIDSIINQSFSNWEFIICDDGSTDNTLDILKQYQEKDKRITIIRNENSQGLAYSLNRCILLAKSNIIARQDADDYSATNRFEIQYKFVIDNSNYAIVGTCWYNVVDGVNYKHVVPSKPSALDQVKGGLYMHPSWMMRKDLIAKVGYYTVNKHTLRSQDYHLVMKVLGSGMQMYNMQDFLYYYTIDEKTKKRSLNWSRVLDIMWIRYDSYRRNHLPLWCYMYVFKPIITNLLPQKIMMKYYDVISKK